MADKPKKQAQPEDPYASLPDTSIQEDPYAALPDTGPKTLPTGDVTAPPHPFTLNWVKENANKVMQNILDILPTAGAVAGGLAAGGAGLETGPGAILTGAAGAAAGGGLGEIAKQEGEELLFPNRPKQTAKEAAKDIGKQAVIQGASELTGRAAGKIINPAINYFGKTAAESSKAGVHLLPSEAGGKAPSYAEKFLKGSVLTSGKMDRFRVMQNAETQSAVNKLADQMATFTGTPEQLGDLVQNGIKHHTEQFRVLQKQMYDDIATDVGEHDIQVPITKQVDTGLVDANGKPITKAVTTYQTVTVDNVMPSTLELKKFAVQELKKLDEVEKVLDPNLLGSSRKMLETLRDAPNKMTYKAIASARSDAIDKARELDQALAGKQAGLAKKMASLFDDSMIDAAQKSNIPGLVQKIRDANAFTANEHKMFEQELVDKIVKTKKPEAIATLVRNPRMGNQETRDLFSVLPKNLHKPVQRQIILDTMRQSTNMNTKIFNERKFAETIAKIGDERGQIIFGPNWKNIKELTGIMERINGPVGMQGGAGAALQNFSILKNAMLLAIPGGEAFRGELGPAVGSLAGEWASLNLLASAMIHPAAATKMLVAARQVVKYLPYAVTGAVAETGGTSKNFDRVKAEAKKLQDKLGTKPANPTPAPAPITPLEGLPDNVTHVYDPDTDSINAVQ